MSDNVLAALRGVRYIAQHWRDEDKDKEVLHYTIYVAIRKYISDKYLVCTIDQNMQGHL